MFHSKKPLLIYFIIAAVLLLFGLDRGSLVNSDDALYAIMAWEMFTSGHPFNITYNGLTVFEKPPMLFWMAQPFFALLGKTDLAVRLPSALASVFLSVLLASWGRRQYKAQAAFISGLVFLAFTLSSWLIYFNSRRVMTDPLFWLFVFLLFDLLNRKGSWPVRLGAGFALSFAILAKGLAVMPAVLAIIIWFFWQGLWRKWLLRDYCALFVPPLLLAFPWFLGQFFFHGSDFVSTQLGLHGAGRFSRALYNETSYFYYARRLIDLEGIYFFFLLALGATGGVFRAFMARHPLDRLLVVFFVVYALIITVMKTRLDHYVIPLVFISIYFLSHLLALLWTTFSRFLPRAIFLIILAFSSGYFFLSHNLHHLLASDYSPQEKALGEILSHLTPGESQAGADRYPEIVSLDDYQVALGWYSGIVVEQWATSHRLCSIYSQADMLSRSGSMWCGSLDDALERMATHKPLIISKPGTIAGLAGHSELKGYCGLLPPQGQLLLLLPPGHMHQSHWVLGFPLCRLPEDNP